MTTAPSTTSCSKQKRDDGKILDDIYDGVLDSMNGWDREDYDRDNEVINEDQFLEDPRLANPGDGVQLFGVDYAVPQGSPPFNKVALEQAAGKLRDREEVGRKTLTDIASKLGVDGLPANGRSIVHSNVAQVGGSCVEKVNTLQDHEEKATALRANLNAAKNELYAGSGNANAPVDFTAADNAAAINARGDLTVELRRVKDLAAKSGALGSVVDAVASAAGYQHEIASSYSVGALNNKKDDFAARVEASRTNSVRYVQMAGALEVQNPQNLSDDRFRADMLDKVTNMKNGNTAATA